MHLRRNDGAHLQYMFLEFSFQKAVDDGYGENFISELIDKE